MITNNNFGIAHKLCEDCGHKEVCNKKEILEFVQTQLNETVNCALRSNSILRLKDCDWISVDLQCKYWLHVLQNTREQFSVKDGQRILKCSESEGMSNDEL